DRKYADDDLIVGSLHPFELFCIFNEIVGAGVEGNANVGRIAYMIDQSHNIEPKVEAMIQSVINIQIAYARAQLVNRSALREAMKDISTSTVLAQLVARSRKLGADRSICNWGGGNTSAKADEVDFRGRPARILWVKGSGSDLATVTEASFTGLYLDDILPLLERERMSDAEMVDYLAHCFYEPGRPRPSIETLLHGFLPFAHVDHTHADATNY